MTQAPSKFASLLRYPPTLTRVAQEDVVTSGPDRETRWMNDILRNSTIIDV
jgi:hypothetical protein